MPGSGPHGDHAAGGLLARPAVHVAALTVLALVFFLGRVAGGPLDGDPAMYATIAKTIVHTGEWVHLTFNGEPYLNKPPLHFWTNALVFRVLPPTAFTAVLLPGLFGVAGVLLLYALCRVTLGDGRTALAASLVYLTTPEVVHWGGGVHLETQLVFCLLIGLLAAFRSVATASAVVWLAVAAAGGWLTKGPQGLFPLAVAAILWAHEGVWSRRLLSAWTLVALLLFAVATGPWLWVRFGEGSDFARTYFGGQIGRVLFQGGTLERGPAWYVGKLLRTYWPWLPVAAVGLVMLARRWRASLGARLWLTYAGVVMIVISLAIGKKSRYLFPLYPALAVAAGVALGAAAQKVGRLLAALLGSAAVAAGLLLIVGGDHVTPERSAHARAARAVAAQLAATDRVWLTRRVQRSEQGFAKVLGFYAPTLLYACQDWCASEAGRGSVVISRGDEAEKVAGALGGRVHHRTPELAIVAIP